LFVVVVAGTDQVQVLHPHKKKGGGGGLTDGEERENKNLSCLHSSSNERTRRRRRKRRLGLFVSVFTESDEGRGDRVKCEETKMQRYLRSGEGGGTENTFCFKKKSSSHSNVGTHHCQLEVG
jgi:hypothetical protein